MSACLFATISGHETVCLIAFIAGGIMGVGSVQRFSAVHWGVARSILWAWILTIPVAGLVAAFSFWLIHHFIPAA